MTREASVRAGEELLRRFAAALRAGQLYSKGHPIVAQNLHTLVASIQPLLRAETSIVLGVVGEEIIFNEAPVPRADNGGVLVRRLKHLSIERVAIERGVTNEEIEALVDAIGALEPKTPGEPPPFPPLPHVRVGHVTTERRVDGGSSDMPTLRRLYQQAVSSAEILWESARVEARPDATVANTTIDGLVQAVSRNRTALLALTALKDYDNYTFTHMVNVSILTLGQARALGVDGPLLREFGLAALMHDIGKVRTPLEILNKPDALTEGEFAIMQRHTVDGAEILRATPDMPALAPIVAFEHHLRLDGTGYPHAATRPTLNLGTMLCAIADVYDAMRSQRHYQQAFPTDRILAVLKRNDGRQFDQHLVRRFSQLIGIYPAGNLVRLATGEIAVVLRVYAPDPRRPRVRIVLDRNARPVDAGAELNLWDAPADNAGAGDAPGAIVAPVDPAEIGIDPLTFL